MSAYSMRGILTLRRPVENTIIVSFDDAEKMLHNTFYNDLRMAPEECCVIITESPLNPTANHEKMIQIMFETFNVPLMAIIPTSSLALYASGRATGLVIESGYDSTFVVPIHDGIVIPYGIKQTNMGGQDITEMIRANFGCSNEAALAMKESIFFVSQNLEEDRNVDSSFFEKDLVWNNTDYYRVGKERFEFLEIFFSKADQGKKTIPLLIQQSIMELDESIREDMLSNLILAGGNTCFPGFASRLQMEVKNLFPSYNVKVIAPYARIYSVYAGLNLLKYHPQAPLLFLTKEEYDQQGPKADTVATRLWKLGGLPPFDEQIVAKYELRNYFAAELRSLIEEYLWCFPYLKHLSPSSQFQPVREIDPQ